MWRQSLYCSDFKGLLEKCLTFSIYQSIYKPAPAPGAYSTEKTAFSKKNTSNVQLLLATPQSSSHSQKLSPQKFFHPLLALNNATL